MIGAIGFLSPIAVSCESRLLLLTNYCTGKITRCAPNFPVSKALCFKKGLTMEFSDKELAVIAGAKKKIKTATLFRVLLIVVMLCGITLMATGVVVAEYIVYLAFGAVVLAIGLPQFGPGPKYEELLNILDNKANAQRSKT
ncbi:hypothetical protein [Rheinheimera sp. MMS21-TC3]|uniref:hypothetical protein n=1 Tax=Rheinheimera sp. MMS21-TC3 TaxID=3072790 RepID=UPI0028C4F49A|nr:hypothetical protein [Rheinheimera sp. MMS21-TC3]WNO59429.1 hypothetical protein RDV63_00230 [Rheinheimera sp. MMS21-TC3]